MDWNFGETVYSSVTAICLPTDSLGCAGVSVLIDSSLNLCLLRPETVRTWLCTVTLFLLGFFTACAP